jgi:hypothetical protein
MITRSEEFFRKHGGKSVLFGRFFGPVRGTIPTVAGMMDMTWRHFMIANVISGILWAPVIPVARHGVRRITGDCLPRRRTVAMLLLIIVAVLLWFTTWLVQHTVRLFQAHATDGLQRFTAWSQGPALHRPDQRLAARSPPERTAGTHHAGGAVTGQCGVAQLSLSAAGQQLPSGIDQSLYHFFQELRTPWVDALMVFTTELGDYQVTLPLAWSVLVWLIGRAIFPQPGTGWRRWVLAWPPTCCFAGCCQWPVPRWSGIGRHGLFISLQPRHVQHPGLRFSGGADRPGNSASPPLEGLSGRSVHDRPHRLRPPVSGHSLADRYAGGSVLGLIWVTVLGAAYNHHPKTALHWRGLLAYSVIALLATDLLHVSLDYQEIGNAINRKSCFTPWRRPNGENRAGGNCRNNGSISRAIGGRI